jgi:cyclohexyl-isocyanide hydratase
VTSISRGSLLLGAAGLLNVKTTLLGRCANASAHEAKFPPDARVVVDRNWVTGGGVTGGIDFGLVLSAKLRGDDAAQLTQLAMGYDPQPPFHSGSPKAADPRTINQAMTVTASEMEKLVLDALD